MTSPDLSRILLASTARVLRPLIRILLRHGIGYAAFSQLAKRVYFESARNDFTMPGKRQTASRISTMTGLSRKEVTRLESLPDQARELDSSGINRAARVISGWVRDPEFLDRRGEPADLAFDNAPHSFADLVKKFSGDITARTIADELTRVGAITMTASGMLHLNTRAYIAGGEHADSDRLTMLGTDVASLIETIEHNMVAADDPRFQRKVAYSTIPHDALPNLKKQLVHQAQASLESMDKLLAAKSAGKRASKSGKYRRVGVGIYYFEEDQA